MVGCLLCDQSVAAWLLLINRAHCLLYTKEHRVVHQVVLTQEFRVRLDLFSDVAQLGRSELKERLFLLDLDEI